MFNIEYIDTNKHIGLSFSHKDIYLLRVKLAYFCKSN